MKDACIGKSHIILVFLFRFSFSFGGDVVISSPPLFCLHLLLLLYGPYFWPLLFAAETEVDRNKNRRSKHLIPYLKRRFEL